MPYLMVNLDDPRDCRRAMRHLDEMLGGPPRRGPEHGPPRPGRKPCPPEHGPERGPGRHEGRPQPGPWKDGKIRDDEIIESADKLAKIRALPLPTKLERMKQRGLWKHLVAIAELGDGAKSLSEFDQELGLPVNKMRSLKAIMAKLENRFDLRFLRVDEEAGHDSSGNPRYAMPPRIRKHILKAEKP